MRYLVLTGIEDNAQNLSVFHYRNILALKGSADLVVTPSVLRLAYQKPSGDCPQWLRHILRHRQLALDLEFHQFGFLLAELAVAHPHREYGHSEGVVVRRGRHYRIGDISDSGRVGVEFRCRIDHGSGLRSVDTSVFSENVGDAEIRKHDQARCLVSVEYVFWFDILVQ